MRLQRVALICDNTVRPETTGLYCRRALGQLVEVEHLLPTQLDAVPAGRFDLFLNVDDGLRYRLPARLRPAAWWVIDTHLDFEWAATKAADFEFVFAAQRDGTARLKNDGIADAIWLPLACDPVLHGRRQVPIQHDVAFVGNLFPGPRTELLEAIRARFPNTFVGRRYFEEMAETYSAARIAFNRSIANDVNMRVFEALAAGPLLVTNDLAENGLDELFEDGRHCVTYHHEGDLLASIAWLLAHPDACERIAQAGREEVLARHTYLHRMQTLLETVRQHTMSPPRTRTAQKAPPPIKPTPAAGYYEFARPEVVNLIPYSARRVLDVGCGAGRLGEALKQRQEVEVVGIELNPLAAEAASSRLDQVAQISIEDDSLEFPPARFDAIVCADILEHLRDPAAVLRRLRNWLAPDGTLVASVPNVRHHSVISSLLNGNWTYESAGLLDQDHVRFFTRRELQKLFHRAGFNVTHLGFTAGPDHAEWLHNGQPRAVRLGPVTLEATSARDAAEFIAYQYLITASPTPASQPGLTSIVILTHNQLPYTQRCLDSIRLRTDEPYELIIVDNASTDGTVEFLRTQSNVTLIENAENRGFPTAVNQGVRAAQGENILLLNNDVIVTTGWLRRMLDVLDREPQVGLVGPVSNRVSGPQQVPVTYESLDDLDGFGWDWGESNAGRMVETDRLVGFCLLTRRAVWEQVGNLDEQFGVGCYEDDDFCRRARAAGYRAVIAVDAFIHHFGSVTFQGSGADLGAILTENQQKYDAKWKSPNTNNEVESFVAESGSLVHREAAVPSLTTNTSVRLSLCMIVRNNAGTIRPCLESIRTWVDEMIVFDTGSTDDTPQICAELGAKVFEFPWCDDFSAARNESLKNATGKWIFWMDSDDTIPADCGRKLRQLVNQEHPAHLLGYVMQVHCPGSNPHDVTIVDHVKLFPNRPDLRFERRIHEQVLPAIRRAGGDVAFTDIYVVHSGSDHSPESRQRKLERDLRILHLENDEEPNHPFVLFNLGMTYADVPDHAAAVQWLRQCVAVSQPQESHLRKAYALLIGSLHQLGEESAAEEACTTALHLFPDDRELLFRSALLHQHHHRLREAEHAYLRVLAPQKDRHFASIDYGLTGYKARHNLALVYEELQDDHRAEEQWRLAIAEQPEFRPARRSLGELLLRQHRHEEARALIEQLLSIPALRCEGRLLSARQYAYHGAIAEAKRELELAQVEFVEDLDPLHEICRLLFENVSPAVAEPYLEELTSRSPDEPANWRNLAAARRSRGDQQGADEAMQKSLTCSTQPA